MRGPTLTRRGWFAVLLASLAFFMGWQFGSRGLNAIVAPAVVLLAAGYVQIRRVDPPSITRRGPKSEFIGNTIQVELTIDTDRPISAVVEDEVPPALDANTTFRTSLDNTTLSYTLHLRNRGVHQLGPVTVTVTDILNLWKHRFSSATQTEITVYPRIHQLNQLAEEFLDTPVPTDNRDHFDELRAYQRGDPLRDINWKASAKWDEDLVVTEYAGRERLQRTRIGVSIEGPRTDEAAEATVSLAAHLLQRDTLVGVITPETTLEPEYGEAHLKRILKLGARLSIGDLPVNHRDRADILVIAPTNGDPTRIHTAGRAIEFRDLRRSPAPAQ